MYETEYGLLHMSAGTCRAQKRASDPLEALKLDNGNRTQVFWKSSTHS